MPDTLDIVRRNNGQWMLTLFFPIAILGKLLRWTVLKHTLVDMSIGHGMAPAIVSGNTFFATSFNGGSATTNANFIFSALKAFECRTFTHFEIAISIILNLLVFWMIYDFIRRNDGLSMFQFIVAAFFIGVLNVYTFTLAKEPAQMLYFFLMYPVLRSQMSTHSKWLWCLAIIALIICFTRVYLVLMLMFTLIFVMIYPWLKRQFKGSNIAAFVTFLVLAGLIYFFFLNIMKVAKPIDFEELIRVRLRESSATTDIRAVIPSRSIGLFCVNYIITAVRLLVPVELVVFGPKYLLCALFQVLISFSMIRYTLNYDECSDSKRLVICLFWGFLFCSAAFEPDFGSWTRHESVIFPFLIFAFDNDNNEESSINNVLFPA